MRGLEGRIAVVTGASRGIGLAIAHRLLQEGVRVAAISRSECRGLNEQWGHTAQLKAYSADISDSDQIKSVTGRVLADHSGGIDFLVNNAGITRDGLLMRMSNTDWEDVIRTDLTGPALLTQAFARPLMKSGQGRIVNISSVIGLIGLTGNAGQTNYAAAKAGLIGFTRSVAREFSSRGTTANIVCPGFIETDMTAGIPDPVRERYRQEIPIQRFGKPEDVAGIVAFLCSAEASYITGAVITVDGGLAM